MSYISLDSCIKTLGDKPQDALVELIHDKKTGWHVVVARGNFWSFIYSFFKSTASIEEICAEVNLVDKEESDRVISAISSAFQEVYPKSKMEQILNHEFEAYQELLKTAGSDIEMFRLTNNPSNPPIKNQSLLFQIALKAAKRDGREVAKYIKNYGITDKQMLFQIALVAAAQRGSSVSEYIKYYGITDQKMLYEIALKAAAQNGSSVSEYIKDYGIIDQKMLYEIALMAAAESGRGVSEYIKNYGITDEEMLYQIALVAAAQSGSGVSEHIKNYGITDQKKLYEIALKAAAQSGSGVSEHIKNYGITDQKKLYEIALKAAAQNGSAVSWDIKKYGITDEEMLYQIALVAAAQDGGLVCWLSTTVYGITGLDKLFRIGLVALVQNEEQTLPYIQHLRLDAFNLFKEIQLDPSKIDAEHRAAFLDLIKVFRKEGLPEFLLAENPDPFIQKGVRSWILKLLMSCEKIRNKQIIQEQELFTQLVGLRNPLLRKELTTYLPLVFAPENNDSWEELKTVPYKTPKKDRSLLSRMLLCEYQPEVSRAVFSKFYELVKDSFHQEVFLLFLQRIKQLQKEDQESLLKKISEMDDFEKMLGSMKTMIDLIEFGHSHLLSKAGMKDSDPEKQLAALFEQKLGILGVTNFQAAYATTIGKFRKKNTIFSYGAALMSHGTQAFAYFKDIVTFILKGAFYEKRYDIPHLKMIFNKFPSLESKWRKGETDLTEADLSIDPVTAEGEIPIPFNDMYNVVVRFSHLGAKDDYPHLFACLNGLDQKTAMGNIIDEIKTAREKVKCKIQLNCIRLLDQKLTIENKRKYLDELARLCDAPEFKSDIKAWQNQMLPVIVKSDYTISDTDDPKELLLLGEEVDGSCQRITGGNPGYNKGLLGYMLNGYNRAVIVKDNNDTIIARSLLRLYWDGERPVLYQERFYSRGNDPKLKDLVNAMCIRRAKEMNLTLVSENVNKGNAYPKPLRMCGGRSEFEYVDAIGGMQDSNHYVPRSYIIWSPTNPLETNDVKPK